VSAPPERRPQPVWELARLFLRLGATAFGGPAAHIVFMEQEVVARRGWMTRQEFLDLYGVTNLLPGPNSTEMAIHIGLRRAGWIGLLVAGTCFILPAALATLVLAWAYVRWGALPRAEAVLAGVKPAIVAIVAAALVRFARTAVKAWSLAAIGVAAVVASALGVHELAVLGAGGAAAVMLRRGPRPPGGQLLLGVGAGAAGPGIGAGVAGVGVGLAPLFLIFLKAGALLFGSGYVLLAFLRADLVHRTHWLTEPQLLDAIVAGQLTPGPVFSTATFVGYILRGVPGAVLATVAIFLPAFIFVALAGRVAAALRRAPAAAAFLDGVNVASLALMAVVTVQLGRAATTGVTTAALKVVALGVLLVFPRLSSMWVLLAGALTGALFSLLGVPG
jgi:chromate transporter